MWRSKAWGDLLRWCESSRQFRRDLIVRRTAQTRIRKTLSDDRIATLTADEFTRCVATRGCVRYADGTPIPEEDLAETSPERLAEMLAADEAAVTGNPMLAGTKSPPQNSLPGMAGPALEKLREALRGLLSARIEEVGEVVARAGDGEGPLTRELAAQVIGICSRGPRPIWDPVRVLGLQRLGMLLGAGTRWAGVAHQYNRFHDAFAELRAASDGVLREPLAADLLLCRLARQRGPKAWKIAIGLSETRAEAEAIARRCLEGGFAAIAPENPDDLNISRLRSLVPGDCVVMHLRGRIGAVGRVTRPYYEIDRDEAGPLDRCWWRRVGVEWIRGDRDYGDLLAGAQQRFSVVELDWDCFRAIARMYRHQPEYDRLLRPLHGGWLIHCDDSRYQSLAALDKPLPLRDQWSLALGESRPAPGDSVFLYHHEAPRGVFGMGTVISDPQRIPHTSSCDYRVELVYEVLADRPVTPPALRRDPRTRDLKAPAGQVSDLTPEQVAALCELLRAEELEHFVLLSGGTSGNIVHEEESYRIRDRSSESARRLVEASEGGQARCLIYHGPPENAFVGFGTVAEISDRSSPAAPGPGEGDGDPPIQVRLDVRRFAKKMGGWSPPAAEPGGSRERSGDGITRTVLPVSAHDFYRVVGAGMASPAREKQVISLHDLADEAGAPVERLEEMEQLLRDKGQMIFYGPPGTGKTWLALRLARYLSEGDERRQRVVQFHPAYSYEDFIEGIRPQVVEGADGFSSVDYPLVRGSFATFCDRARQDAQNTHVFVIDEINRAQVAAVFGELMLALEYRGREVRLAHGAEPGGDGGSHLSVPPNVLVIATMNTADRSTALVDHALRRRFVFYPLFPDDEELVRPMFESWLDEHAPEARWVSGLLAQLNQWLEPEVGRHLLVGHTYFMKPGLDEPAVRRIWRFQIRPLLEEYFAALPDRLAELDLDELIWRARENGAPCEGADAGPATAHVSNGRLWWGGEDDV